MTRRTRMMPFRLVKEHAGAATAVAMLAVVLMAAAALGVAGRHFVAKSDQLRIESDGPRDLYHQLLRTGVKGRTLILFDRDAAISERDYRFRALAPYGSPLPLEPVDVTNQTAWLIRSGVVRRVFIVLPEDRWEERLSSFRDAWNVFAVPYGYERRMDGAPVVYTSLSEMKGLRLEKAVVIVNEAERASYDPAALEKWTAPDNADIVVTTNGD